MRIDEELSKLFIEAYQAKLAWAQKHADMYFAMNRANGVGMLPREQMNSAAMHWATKDYQQFRDVEEPAAKIHFNSVLESLLHTARLEGLDKNEILAAFNDGVKKAAETLHPFLRWRLTDDESTDVPFQINQRYRDTSTTPAPNAKDTKVALESFKASLLVYIESRKIMPTEYFGKLDRFFGGHDRATKLAAAKKLHDYNPDSPEKLQLTKQELAALKQGRLKLIAKDKLALIKDKIEIIKNSPNSTQERESIPTTHPKRD